MTKENAVSYAILAAKHYGLDYEQLSLFRRHMLYYMDSVNISDADHKADKALMCPNQAIL